MQRVLAKVVVTFLLGAALLVAPRARAADPDPWIAKDKAFHFGASASLAIGGYGIGAYAFDARGHALLLGAGIAMSAGIAKESLDLAGYGVPSWKDVAWDGIGIATGLALAWGLDLLIRGVSARHPLLTSPAR
jgi:putative lipoprotein